MAHCNRTPYKVPKASLLGGFLDLVKRGGVLGVVILRFCIFSFIFCIMQTFKSPKLTPYNYATWSIKMWYHLMHNGVSQYVDGTIPKPVGDKVT